MSSRNSKHYFTANPHAVRGGGLLSSNPKQPAIRTEVADEDDAEDQEFEVVEGPISAAVLKSASVAPNGKQSSSSTMPHLAKERPYRESSVDSSMIDDDDDDDDDADIGAGQPAAKRRKLSPQKPAPGRIKQVEKKKKPREPDFVSDLPWPAHFQTLEKTFKALNTVYTFCSARKSMATTFDVLKGSVENLLRRPLEMHDIAQIKSLLPSLVTFAYIDSELLRVHSAGGDEASVKRAEKMRELDEAYRYAAQGREKRGKEKKETVLLFSFNDGELKSINGVGKVISRKFQPRKTKADQSKPSKAPETVPKFSTESMATMIAKRNAKFSSAVSELVVACSAHDPPQDPVELLLQATEENLPVKPDDVPDRKGLGEKKDDLDFYRRNPGKRPSIEDIIEEIKEEESYEDQIVDGGHRIFDAREPIYGEMDVPLSDAIWDALYQTKKISQVYSHQAQAINYLGAGKNVIVSTSTSSGKSLIYQIPMVRALEQDKNSTGLYIFPTKALAQDQKRGLGELLGNCDGMEDIKIATFDGDTPRDDRDYIRENASVIFTNPDMLHLTILPREESWRRFFRNLKFVVVDELHVYAGLFGCHVALVMRRLRRICAALGNRHVQFISCSATIANPSQHMQAIFGIEDIMVVDADGSPTGRKEYLIWNPAYIDENDVKQGRVSTITETSRIFRFLMDRGVRAIVFCKVRRQCEILMKQVRSDLMLEGRSDMASRIMAYRSGYSPADRRKIEQEMFTGQLLGVIATTALELGIDIGSLDAVITVGFPYTLPGLRQQAGRAGRRNKDSLAMLICDPFPLDQHYARNPDTIFSSPYNQLLLDLENPIVLEAHIQCAAEEMPIKPSDDLGYFGLELSRICEDRLIKDEEGFYHCHPRYKPYPAKSVPIRNTEDESFSVVDVSDGRSEVIEEIEFSRAIFTIYEGAVFMHQGRTFLVKEMDHDRKLARVAQATIDWQTRQRDFTNIDPMEALAIREVKGSDCTASYGTVKITSVVFGYFKTDRRNNILDTIDISSPPFTRHSHGFWIDVPRRAMEILILKNLHPAGSIHAAEHALMSLTPIVAMCTEGDVRTECKQPEKELANTPSSRKRPARIILYDTAGKSGGICAKAFDHVSMLLNQAADTIASCKCLEGCPSCVASTLCSGANMIVSKLGALVVLESILNRPIDIDAIPEQPPAFGVTPGGTIDLLGAGIKPPPPPHTQSGNQSRKTHLPTAHGTGAKMSENEMDAEAERERDRILRELLGGDDTVTRNEEGASKEGTLAVEAPITKPDPVVAIVGEKAIPFRVEALPESEDEFGVEWDEEAEAALINIERAESFKQLSDAGGFLRM